MHAAPRCSKPTHSPSLNAVEGGHRANAIGMMGYFAMAPLHNATFLHQESTFLLLNAQQEVPSCHHNTGLTSFFIFLPSLLPLDAHTLVHQHGETRNE